MESMHLCMDSFLICRYTWGMALDSSLSPKGEWHIITPEEEIRALEAKLAEKKREHAAAGGALEGAPHEEKEIFREVMREHIAENRAPVDETHIAPARGVGAPLAAPDSAAAAVREQKLATLVEYAFTYTIEAAVSRAEKETPYLIDELHDRLADQYYEKLVQLRKLEAL